MKKSLSLLLAIALVFGMFSAAASAATPSTAAEAGALLKEYGVLKGADGENLLENEVWKRQDIYVLLSRLLNKEEEAASTAKSHTWKDVKGNLYDSVLSWAKEEGLANGYSATKFGFNDQLTVKDFSAITLRALGINNYATVEEDAVKAGIFPEGTDFSAKATRGDTFVSLVVALNTEVAGTGKTLGATIGLPGFENAAASAISSVAVTSAKKLTVTFNGAVDTEKAKITVWNGTNQVNSKSVTFSEDKKSAVVEFALNLPAAEYTVKVEGLSETALSATVKVEAEKVAKIEFKSDKVALNRVDNTKVSVGYKVLNQYDEDITANTSLSATAGKGTATTNPATGTLNIAASQAFVLGEKVTVSLVHTSGTYATATLEVSSVAQVSSIDIVKLYNADNKTLEAGSTDTFYLLLDLKDQYGASVTDTTYLNTDLIVTVSNTSKADLIGYNGTTNTANYYTVPIDGKNHVAFQLKNGANLNAGTSTVTLISKANGAKDQFDISVKENVKIDTLTLSAPASAPAGATVNIPFTAIDQFGNEIKHPTNSMVSGGTMPARLTFEKDHVKDVTNLKLDLTGLTDGSVFIVNIVTHTNKVATLTVNVTAAAKPTVITGIKDLETALLKANGSEGDGGSVSLNPASNLVIKDQYGNDATGITWGTTHRLVIESSDAAKVKVNGGASATVTAATNLTAHDKGSSSITLTLEAWNATTSQWEKVQNSSYTYTAKVVDKTEITEYTATIDGKVKQVGTVGYVANHDKEIKVVGLLADGNKVTVPNSVYNYVVDQTSLPGNISYNTGTKKVQVEAAYNGYDTGKNEANFNIVVVIQGANGQEVKVIEAVASKENSNPASIGINATGIASKEGDNVISVTQANIRASGKDALANAAFETKDQFGVVIADAYTTYVGNFSNANRQDTSLVESGDTFNLTAVAGGKTITVKVIVK